MRLNADQSPNAPVKEIGAVYGAAWQKWAEAHPDWQVQFEFFSQDIGAEHARLLEQARAGRSPDCVTVDSFQLALFVQNGVLQPLDAFFSKEEIDDLFPFIREGITGPDGHIYAWWWGTDLRVLYYNTDIVKTRAADLGRAAGDRARGRRSPASTACSSTAGAGRAPPSTGWPTSGRRGASSSTTDGKPIFGEGENREKMLKALNYFKGLVDSGAAPKRVATIKTYDDFNAAAQSGTTAMFLGGHWQHFQLEAAMPPDAFAKWAGRRAARADPGRARHRHRRLDRRRLRQGPGEDRGLRLADARGLHGAGQRGRRRPADPPVALRVAAEVPGSLLRPAQRIPGARPCPSRACRSTPRSRTRSRS